MSDFPEYHARDYGVMRDLSPLKKQFLPLAKAMLARAYITSEPELAKIFDQWCEFHEYSEDFMLFEPEESYKTDQHPKGIAYKDMTRHERWGLLRKKIRQEYKGNEDFLFGSHPTLFVPRDKDKRFFADAGRGVTLSGELRSKSEEKIYGPMIKGPFNFSSDWLGVVDCECKYSKYVKMKLGRTDLNTFCLHTYALLEAADRDPYHVKHFTSIKNRRNRQQPNKDVSFELPFKTKWDAKGFLSLDFLMMDVLMQKFVNGSTDYKISTQLKHVSKYLNPRLLPAIYEAVPQKQDLDMHAKIKGYLIRFANMLGDRGFLLSGYAREFIGTEHERICPTYINKLGDEIRIYLNAEMPPLFIFRTLNPERWAALKLGYSEGYERAHTLRNEHPYANLFLPHLDTNDRNNGTEFREIRLPRQGFPSEFQDIHKQLINEHNPGGIEQLTKRLPKNSKLKRQLSH